MHKLRQGGCLYKALMVCRVRGVLGWGGLRVAEDTLLSGSWELLLGAHLEMLPVFDVGHDSPVT